MLYLNLLFLIIVLWCDFDVEASISVRKFVYQKDKSEFCRRRVMPSVFLGRHVMEANSQILHFSQLEVPYSCFVSIRTESGANIILVIQIAVDEGVNICAGNESPLTVFEMGETFGGYWGPLPDSILRATRPTSEKYYTHQTTRVDDSFPDTEPTEDYEETSSKPPRIASTARTRSSERGYFVEEVPILNVSGHLEQSNQPAPLGSFFIDDYSAPDVTPIPGVKYRSSLFPILRVSINAGQSLGRGDGGNAADTDGAHESDAGEKWGEKGNSGNDSEPRYQIDFNFGDFTPDPRLNLEYLFKTPARLGKKYPYNANKRINFKKNKAQMFMKASHSSNNDTKSEVNQTQTFIHSNSSWASIEALLKNLTTDELQEKDIENSLESQLLRRISDWQHNYSAYLAPNLTASLDQPFSSRRIWERNATKLSTENVIKKNSKENSTEGLSGEANSTVTKSVKEDTIDYYQSQKPSTTNNENARVTSGGFTTERVLEFTSEITSKVTDATRNTVEKVSTLAMDVTTSLYNIGTVLAEKVASMANDYKNLANSSLISEINREKSMQSSPKGLTITSSFLTTPATGSMVDHESWGNVVNAAPKIAGALNHSPKIPSTKTHKTRTRKGQKTKYEHRRNKRYIHAIPIEHAKPHNLTTAPYVESSSEVMYHFADLHDFAQLVELQDDKLYGHIALRYMRRYVGAKLFDFCDLSRNRSRSRLVFLFNTSRIVIALNNFTLKRMTLVATPARTLPNPEVHCPFSLLECQVAGARVCIDSMTACDGVPNCGAYDIYDEDRLMCGAAVGLQYNVYLAAFTFLAVLFTMFYTIHYWLKRCIPKVSKAFFIYTDGTENILYLDSIMRSPMATDDTWKLMRNYEDDLDMHLNVHQGKTKRSIFKRIFGFCFRKRKKQQNELELAHMDDIFQREKFFSFPEIEITKMHNPLYVEAGVQTGDSLLMRNTDDDEKLAAKRTTARKVSVDPRQYNKTIQDSRIKAQQDPTLLNSEEDSELSVLKFFRNSRSQSRKSYAPLDEMEIRTTEYERPRSTRTASNQSAESLNYSNYMLSRLSNSPNDTISGTEETIEAPGMLTSTKRLRFQDNLTNIPSEEMKPSETVVLPPDPEPEPTGHMRFWGHKIPKMHSNKNKNKTHLPLNR